MKKTSLVLWSAALALLAPVAPAGARAKCPSPRDVPSWEALARVETGPSYRSMAEVRSVHHEAVVELINGRYYDPPRWNYRGRYHGGLQFSPTTWNAMRNCAGVTVTSAADASPAQQIAVARYVYAVQPRAWPVSFRKLGWT